MPVATANQTIGPYWHLIEDPTWSDLTRFGAEGEKIVLTGTLIDGAGNTVADAAIEIWQTSPAASDAFPAFGRCRTDANGSFRFTTLKPGPVAGLGQCPAGAARRDLDLCPRPADGADDPAVFPGRTAERNRPGPVADRRRSPSPHADRGKVSAETWHLDIRLQGENETVFMEI